MGKFLKDFVGNQEKKKRKEMESGSKIEGMETNAGREVDSVGGVGEGVVEEGVVEGTVVGGRVADFVL